MRTLVPKAMKGIPKALRTHILWCFGPKRPFYIGLLGHFEPKGMVFGTINLKCWVLAPFGLVGFEVWALVCHAHGPTVLVLD